MGNRLCYSLTKLPPTTDGLRCVITNEDELTLEEKEEGDCTLVVLERNVIENIRKEERNLPSLDEIPIRKKKPRQLSPAGLCSARLRIGCNP